jgi:hypothetical protein
VALAVLGWVVVVAIGTGLVWAVVSRAGQGVTEQPDALEDAQGTGTVVQAPTVRPSGQSSGTTSTPPDRSEPTTGATGTGSAATAVRDTWHGAAGVVSVECRGATIRLTGAVAFSGYSAETDDSGPDDVKVEFESGDGERRTRVEAECADGVPAFSVDQDD